METCLDELCEAVRLFPAHYELSVEHDVSQDAFVIHDGWAFSYRLLANGGRQVIDFHVPCDIVGLDQLFLPLSTVSVETVTPVRLSRVSRAKLIDLASKSQEISTSLLEWIARSEARLIERLVDIGRRGTEERTAHLLLELHERLSLAGRAAPDGFSCPLSQYLMSDALGITAIHLNRVLRRLREKRLVTVRQGYVRFHDRSALAALAEFDGAAPLGSFPRVVAADRTAMLPPRPPVAHMPDVGDRRQFRQTSNPYSSSGRCAGPGPPNLAACWKQIG